MAIAAEITACSSISSAAGAVSSTTGAAAFGASCTGAAGAAFFFFLLPKIKSNEEITKIRKTSITNTVPIPVMVFIPACPIRTPLDSSTVMVRSVGTGVPVLTFQNTRTIPGFFSNSPGIVQVTKSPSTSSVPSSRLTTSPRSAFASSHASAALA